MNRLKWKPSLVVAAFVAGVIALLFYPFETTVVREWKLQVVDEAGHSVQGVPVSESWSDYTIGADEQSEVRLSDNEGYVVFPQRVIKRNLVKRLVGKTINIIKVHGHSEGPSAYLLVRGPYQAASDEPYYVPGRPLASQIVVRPPWRSER
jgi:hypothetical protein